MSGSSSKKRAREGITSNGFGVDVPCRDCRDLFVAHETVHCALAQNCVPCAYKVGSFDVALDTEFTRRIPNQRPESCKRSGASIGRQGILGYQVGTKVLTIGDGDFSFSLAVARILASPGSSPVRLVATSYETRSTLVDVYPDVEKTLAELQDLGATVCFSVDATKLTTTLPPTNLSQYDRIVWNFPCEAVGKGQDGQNEAMQKNKDLVRRFVAGARHLVAPRGQIQLNHKTKPPFDQWKIQEVAVAASQSEDPILDFAGRVVFDRFLLPPYVPRKALHRKSFPAHDACTYIFSRQGEDLSSVDELDPLSPNLIRVTPNLVSKIRTKIMEGAEASPKRAKRDKSR